MKKMLLLLLLILCLVQGAFASLCVGEKGHTFIPAGLVKEADCENFGIQKLKCSICGEMKNEVIKALGHSWDSGTITKEATCTETGIITFKCIRCEKTREEAIPSTGHHWDTGTITKKATCTETGIKTFKCIRCEKTSEEAIPSTGHHWEVQDGNYMVLVCNICDSKKTCYGNKGPAGGYIFYDCDADNDIGNKDGLKSLECGWRFLEAAPDDLPETYNWGDYGSFGTKTGIGEGRNNTNIIVNKASKGGSNNAAMACVMYAGGGFSDWFLPSKDELNLMYKNLEKNRIGDFKRRFSNYYLSVSESSYSTAWVQDFSDGYQQFTGYKSNKYYVRPIRAF